MGPGAFRGRHDTDRRERERRGEEARVMLKLWAQQSIILGWVEMRNVKGSFGDILVCVDC